MKIMTLQQLYDYFDSRAGTLSKEDEIHIQLQGKMTLADDYSKEGLMPVSLRACAYGENANIIIEESGMNEALASLYNRPILAYIHELDGQSVFGWHAMHEEDDEIVYDETAVGIIPESGNVRYEADENGKVFVCADGYIFEMYTKATSILEREKECSVSAELVIIDMEYNSESRKLNVKKFYFTGVTILGKDEDGNTVEPAVEGANIVPQSSLEALARQASELLSALSENLLDKNTKEGGKPKMNLFEELLQKYNKTAEDVTFTIEGLSDDELREQFEKAFNPSKVLQFSISHEDTKYGLYELMNWDVYIFSTFDDKFIYQSNDGKTYSQAYSKTDDTLALSGDPVEVFCEYLTAEEKAQLDEMRGSYSKIQENFEAANAELEKVKEMLGKYEAEPEKMEILESQDYTLLAGNEEFEALKENHLELSAEEVKAQADAILLSAAKSQKLNLSADGTTSSKIFVSLSKDRNVGPYGDIFC